MGERLKELRKALGLSQAEFGKRLHLSRNFISLVERGVNGVSERTIYDICSEFCVNEKWFRTGEGAIFDLAREDCSPWYRAGIAVEEFLSSSEKENVDLSVVDSIITRFIPDFIDNSSYSDLREVIHEASILPEEYRKSVLDYIRFLNKEKDGD